MSAVRSSPRLWGPLRIRWELVGAGATLCAYGWFFREDLGGPAYVVIGLGVFVATVGDAAHRWGQRRLAAWPDRGRGPCLSPQETLAQEWRYFWFCLCAMFALGAFSLWRVRMTVWRPVAERYYFFPGDTWLGRLEHSWFNDALYAFGMVGILYVLYTLKEFAGSRFERRAGPLMDPTGCCLTEDQWIDHQERSKLMIGTGIVIILLWAWLEEIADLVPGYIFDKWDINAIYLGFILGYSMMHHLSYPVFGASPPFYVGPADRSRWLQDGIRLLYVVFVWTYTWLMEPSTYGDRWSHIAEVSAIILGSIWLLDVRRRPAASVQCVDRLSTG